MAKKPQKKKKDEELEDLDLKVDDDPSTEAARKGYYFDNHKVEQLLAKYVSDGCVNVALRDEIMGHASELIRQIIRTHNFHNIYPGSDDASFGDLFQAGWCQIESVLYKFDSTPGHTKVFNMWSQVAKTVMLAHIKKETRDKKNYGSYKNHLDTKTIRRSVILERFMSEAKEICKYNLEYCQILEALTKLYESDPRPHEGLIGKLVAMSKMSRSKVSCFLRTIRLRSFEFTDAPAHDDDEVEKKDGRIKRSHTTSEEEEYDS